MGHYVVGRYVRSNVCEDVEMGFQTTCLRAIEVQALLSTYKNTRYVCDLPAIATL